MPTPAQIGAASAAIGGGALGGYFLANGLSSTGKKLENSKDDLSLPKAEVFGSSTTFDSSSPYHGKLLTLTHQDHLEYLVKPTWDKGEEWWKWAFENKFSKKDTSKLDSVFSKVSSHYSTTAVTNGDQTSLNQACDIAYKKEKADYKFGATDYLLKNISDFCTKKNESVDVSEPKFLAYDTNYSPTEEYEVGVLSVSTNLKNLVKKESTDTDNNELWWKWAYAKRVDNKKTDLSTSFSGVTSGYDASAASALNNACDAAYKKNKASLTKTVTSPVKDKLIDEIKKLCSVDTKKELTPPNDDTEPSTKTALNSTTAASYTTGLGKVDEKRSKLVDPNLEANKKWWWWAFRNRYPTLPEGTVLHTDFNDVTKGYDASGTISLNKKCEEAYKKEKTKLESDSNRLLNNIKQFCTVSNTQDLTSDNVT